MCFAESEITWVYGINGYCWSAVSDIVLSLQGKKRHLYAF